MNETQVDVQETNRQLINLLDEVEILRYLTIKCTYINGISVETERKLEVLLDDIYHLLDLENTFHDLKNNVEEVEDFDLELELREFKLDLAREYDYFMKSQRLIDDLIDDSESKEILPLLEKMREQYEFIQKLGEWVDNITYLNTFSLVCG